jgi:uncharacterized protein (DUF1697 family)
MAGKRQVVLLRGINVGRHKRVGMADLRALLTELGYGDVRTLLQSGNVVLTSGLQPRQLERQLASQLEEGLGFEIALVVRTRDELADAIERNPLGGVATDPSKYLVSFLSAELEPAIARELSAADVAPARLAISGRELFCWHPNGLAASPLAKLLGTKPLGVTSTARNWSTVTKLLALADD